MFGLIADLVSQPAPLDERSCVLDMRVVDDLVALALGDFGPDA
nr:hypothetical protein [Halobiforma haloterrestris]